MRKFAKEKKVLIENLLSLSFLQIANYALPLITIPYLVRVLGPEKFGLIMFVQAFTQYFIIVTDYGFNLSATRKLSIERHNKDAICSIFSSVMLIKALFVIIGFAIFLGIVALFPRFRDYWFIYLFTFGAVIGNALFPVWFFQGLEKMRYITYLTLLAKSIFTVSIFVFIRRPSQYMYVPLINSAGMITAGIVALWIVFKNINVKLKIPSIEDMRTQLREGVHIFISTVAVTGYTNTRIFVVGLFTGYNITGYYAIAEKLAVVVQLFPLASVVQAVYPWLSKVYSENSELAKKIVKKLQNITTLCAVIAVAIIFYFAPLIIKLVCAVRYKEVIAIFRLLLISVLFIDANAFRVNFLVISGKSDLFAKIHIISAVVGIMLLVLSVSLFSYMGSAVSAILVEFYVLSWTVWAVNRNTEKYIS